jgi:Immunity protein 51
MRNSVETSLEQNCEMPLKIDELESGLTTDSATFAPFILVDGHCRALIIFDTHMALKRHIFLEQSTEGWTGNGDDWTSVAEVVVAECLCTLTEPVSFDSGPDLFSARGCRSALEKLAFQLQAIYRNDDAIRDLMSRVIAARNVNPTKFEPQESTRPLSYQSRRTLWM